MEIICSEYCGFCRGVNYSVNKALEVLQNNNEKIYCLGQIVHNEWVIKKLEDEGLIIVDNIDEVESNSKLIIRAHGERKEVIESALKRNIEVIDLTCGKIKIIINKIKKEKDNSYIIIIGKKHHPEPIGLLSYASKYSAILESDSDIDDVYKKIKDNPYKRVYIVSQTTFGEKRFDELANQIKEKLNDDYEVVIDKTICDATDKRQKDALELSKQVNKLIVIGGKKSSNTLELYKLVKDRCEESYLIQDVNDLKNITFKKEDRVGIITGASTHIDNVDEIVKYLKDAYE